MTVDTALHFFLYYAHVLWNSPNLQTDFLTADLGHLTNAGFTFRRGLNLIEDDRLGVELAVRISDHLENVDGATQVVLMRQSLIVNPSTTFAGGLPCRSHW